MGRLFDKNQKKALLEYFQYFLPVVLLLFLFFSPISISAIDLYDNTDSTSSVQLIFAETLPFNPNLSVEVGLLGILMWLIYVLPCTAIFSVAAFILGKRRGISFRRLNYFFSLASFSIYLFCASVCLIANANCFAWFLRLPFYVYATVLLAFFAHVYYSFHGIFYLRKSNPEYAEFLKIRADDAEKSESLHVKRFFSSEGIAAFKNSLNRRVRRLSIKTKFTFVITGVIIVILLAFMLLILQRYKKMFTEAVSDVGRAQAEQTAAVYDSAEGRYEKIAAFFEEQRETNAYAETPFERIDIIIYEKNEPAVYLESWDVTTELPEFSVFAYTTGRPKDIDESEKTLTNEQAVDYLKRYKSGAYKKEYVFNKTNLTCKYIYPITFARKAGHKLVGFSIVTYKQQVLMRQFFRTKIFVFTIITIFLYLVVIFSILLADFIFNPLLFLRKNVRKTSRSIEKLLSGTARNTSNAVKFSDTIRTNDEIKDLSLEIGEMVALIKGIMPYVSFSTLQHAEKSAGTDSRKGTTSRDLCFLFTDIRGFTSLCEGMTPKKVVDLLNRYLEIETQIILDNDGDVDKFVGDEMMAFFSGPKKEINACKAAMEIRAAMREQQQLSMEDGSTYVSIGIGINSGKVTFGPVGSRTRKDFTSIGDTVNLAARLESANKAYGSKSIISDVVYQKLRGMFICRELDFITVKGKTEPVRIYEILQHKDKAAEKLLEIKSLFERGLELYRAQKWEESETCFSECALKYNDMPSVVFLDRINHFKTNPPSEDWDGVFKMTVK
ncbi:MAG: adenylate/guanylate cyclase domain-containing protein [Treponema sp.]|nr:adenylate/guanylate cyclase domain-containing protein [Treponema sp.]